MKKKFTLTVIGATTLMLFFSFNAFAKDLELTNLLVNQLDVTPQQATGGAGSMFSLAQKNLEPGQFSKIADAVPGMESFLAAAPEKEKSSGSSLLGAGASILGGDSSGSGLAGLASSFSSLGMDGDMTSKFVPVVLDYVKQKGGDMAMGLLKKAIGM